MKSPCYLVTLKFRFSNISEAICHFSALGALIFIKLSFVGTKRETIFDTEPLADLSHSYSTEHRYPLDYKML